MTRDAERTRRLTLAGWTVAYVTWSQLKEPAAQLQDDLRRLLRSAQRRC
ncbi:MAG: hypothetical protein KDB46_04400 [Solirubrobacterales bacterium]|nr:hypothetical protein [Solirubrobacterales bacterium]